MNADGSLVVDDKGEHSQPGTNDPGTPNASMSMSLYGPGPGDDMKMDHDGNGEHEEREGDQQKPAVGTVLTSTPMVGTPLSRLPMASMAGFPGMSQETPPGVAVPPGWPVNGDASRQMTPQQIAGAMSRLVSGEGSNDPAALASLMGAYYQMMGSPAAAGLSPQVCAATVPGNGQQTTMIKCNSCGFLAPSWPLIMQHVFKVHAAEHNDLFRAFGVSPEVLSDFNKCVPGSGPLPPNAQLPPAMAAMLAAGGMQPGSGFPAQLQQLQQQQQQQQQQVQQGTKRRLTSSDSPMSSQVGQFIANQQQGGAAPRTTAPWPLDLTKSGGSGSGSGSYRDSRSRSSPSLVMNGGGSGSSVSRSTDTPASSSNDAPLTGDGAGNGLDILCRRDLAPGEPSSPASGGSGSGSGSGTNLDQNGRRRSRKGKAVKLSAMRQGNGNGSEGEGEGTSGNEPKVKRSSGWAEQLASALGQEQYGLQMQHGQQRTSSRIDDWAVQSGLDAQGQRTSQPAQPGGPVSNARQVPRPTTSSSSSNFECSHCELAFRDVVMYTIHMGYHGFLDPFKCNMCGAACRDKVDFFLHIARQAHS